MQLTTVWFVLIAVLWTGYFVLEGFDFGVGVILPFLGRGDGERRALINTIGPVWDGNEVWLITAGGATFAAFPQWYASLFSGFYLALLLILVALILRGVSFEFRSKVPSARWRGNWDRAIFWGSGVPALLWGVAFANIVRGVPLNADHVYTGNLLTLLNPYGLLGGLATLSLFALHGAIFTAIKTTGELRARARRMALRLAAAAVPVAAVFLAVSQFAYGRLATDITAALAAVA
ncbi:MAG TPA: cytochrome d ubiquinol oxidase subunit II, partial [Streptosporangiaceae bacterium]